MAGVDFKFNAWVQKAYRESEEDGGKMVIVAKASDDGIDLENDRMSKKAIDKMVSQANNGLWLLPSHSDSFEIGTTRRGYVEENNKNLDYIVEIELDERYPQALTLFEDIEENKSKRQLSIGGFVNKRNPDAVRFEEVDGTRVRVIEDIELDHIAVTRPGFAANPRTGFVGTISKSLDKLYPRVENNSIVKPEIISTFQKDNNSFKAGAVSFIENKNANTDFYWDWDKKYDVEKFLMHGSGARSMEEFSNMSEEKKRKGWHALKKAHTLWVDEEDCEVEGLPMKSDCYFLPHHKVVDGEMVTVLDGVKKSLSSLENSPYLSDLPDKVKEAAMDHLEEEAKSFGLTLEELKSHYDEEMEEDEEDKLASKNPVVTKATVPFERFTKADPNKSWSFDHEDGDALLMDGAGVDSMEEFLSLEDDERIEAAWSKYRSAHAYYDMEADENHPRYPRQKEAYALPHHKPDSDGEYKVFLRGIIAAASSINGARGGFKRVTDDGDREEIYNHLRMEARRFNVDLPKLRPFSEIKEKGSDIEYTAHFVDFMTKQDVDMDWFIKSLNFKDLGLFKEEKMEDVKEKDVEKNKNDSSNEEDISKSLIKAVSNLLNKDDSKKEEEKDEKESEEVKEPKEDEKDLEEEKEDEEEKDLEKEKKEKKEEEKEEKKEEEKEDEKEKDLKEESDEEEKDELEEEKDLPSEEDSGDDVEKSFGFIEAVGVIESEIKKSIEERGKVSKAILGAIEDLIDTYNEYSEKSILSYRSKGEALKSIMVDISDEEKLSIKNVFGQIFDLAEEAGVKRKSNSEEEDSEEEIEEKSTSISADEIAKALVEANKPIMDKYEDLVEKVDLIEKNMVSSKGLPGQETLDDEVEKESNVWRGIFGNPKI